MNQGKRAMLAKKYRLTKNGSYAYLYAHGSRANARFVKLNFVKSRSGVKVGFSVSNKIGHAVVRNKVKRRMRAITRDLIKDLPPCQAVFIASPGIDTMDFAELKKQMLSCLFKSGLIAKPDEKKEKTQSI